MVRWASFRSIKRCPWCEREFLATSRPYCSTRCRSRHENFNRLPDKATTIYFVQVGESGPIKIGHTTGDVTTRLSIIQTGNPEPLRLLSARPGNLRLEIQLHRRFQRYRIRGEWFHPTPDLVSLANAADRLELAA